MTTKELAKLFYDGIEEEYNPDGEEEKIFSQINEILSSKLEFDTVGVLQELIARWSIKGTQKHYVWGFCAGVEVAKAIADTNEELSQQKSVADYMVSI